MNKKICHNCGWEGKKEDLENIPENGKVGKNCCPECGRNDYLEIKK